MKLTSFILFLVLFSCMLTFNTKGENPLQFYNLNNEYGVSIRETNSVCGDLNGFVWISSNMGIIRYSQNDVRTYKLPYESINIITTNITFSGGNLYVFTNNGQIFCYDALTDQFELIINLSREFENPYFVMSELLVDEQGKLWIASEDGIISYHQEMGLKSYLINQIINSMSWYSSNKILLATNTNQLVLLDPTNAKTESFYRFPDHTVNTVSQLLPDEKLGLIWIGTMEEGFYVLKGGLKKELVKLESIPVQPIMAIEKCDDSTLLIGIDGQGVWKISSLTFELLSVMKEDSDNPNSIKGNGVYDIYCAPDNRIWVCTYSGGASFSDINDSEITRINHQINERNTLVNNDVNSVLEDSNGNLWFATNNGVSYLNVKTHKWTTLFHNVEEHAQVFLKLYEDIKGRIWASTFSSGIYILEKNTGQQLKHLSQENTENDFAGDFVFEMFDDSEGNIWIGGIRGDLICYNIETDQYRSFKGLTVFAIEKYSKEKLLLGTTLGLLLFDKNTGDYEVLLESIVTNDMYVKNEEVWIATSGEGVLLYDIEHKFIDRFNEDVGLTSNFVNSIIYYQGYFWLGTEQGLCRLDEKDKTIQTFNSLLNLNKVAFNQNSFCFLKNGKLLLGSNNGAIMFDPQALELSPDTGRIYVQNISVAGRSIREINELKPDVPIDRLENLSLKYYQNTVSLELIAIGVSTHGTKFSWRLEGLDEQWSIPTKNTILSYSNVPSGNYVLKIRLLDSSGSDVIAERALKLNMIPPFWATWWFRFIMVLLVSGIIVFLMFYYIDHLKKRHSEDKIRFFANTAHDIRTSLTLINGPIVELNKELWLSDKGHHYLNLATEQTYRLLKVVSQLMDFQKSDIGKERLSLVKVDVVKTIKNRVMMFESYATTRNIKICFETNQSVFITAFDENMIEKVVDNLLSNAIKYSSSNTEVNVSLQCLRNKWILEVKDRGIGIDRKAKRQLFKEYYRAENAVNSKIVGSGIGLLLVKNYINLHGGKISCSSQLNVGSTFQVVIPTKEISQTDARKAEPKEKHEKHTLIEQDQNRNVPQIEIDESGAKKMKVLIVDDNENLREFIKTSLEGKFHIYLAEDGKKAWKRIQDLIPDLIVSDIVMPNMDGFELCKKIKSTYETAHLPVILLTALAGKAEQIHGLGLGADSYLTKPFDVSVLEQSIKSLVQNRKVIRDRALKLINRNDDSAIMENKLNDEFLKCLIDVVHQNISNVQFSKNDFALAMHVSPSLLYKKLKSLTDQSPNEFIKTIRLKHSVELLQSKKYNVTEVSEMCGFSSVGYFSTVFRKHYGKSPSQLQE